MVELKKSFDWHNPDINETVFLPLLHYFCHFTTFFELKTVNVYKEANSKIKQIVYILRRSTRKFLNETDVYSYFYHNILDLALIDNRIVRVSKVSNKQFFAFKLFQFCNLKNQQRFILEDKMSVSLEKLAAFWNNLRQFLRQYDKTVKFPALYFLPKPKQEIGFTPFKDDFFAHYFQDNKENCNRQIRLFFCFEPNRECCFSIKKFQNVGEQNVLTEIINLRHCEVYNFNKNRYYIASKSEFLISIMTFDSNILAQVLYEDQNLVELIGVVKCPNRNFRGEKCVYLTSLEEINKNTYESKQCKACSRVLKILFKDQKPCVTLFGCTYCFRKKTKLDYKKKRNSRL